ncbi:MAG: phosphate ABC transporter permease subunit PstC [Peptococcaceae bacterium]|nr:phosphate ABC transporter permease subunit PstC [Peptococcaceae bacterium]
MKTNNLIETVMYVVFLIAACTSIIAVFLICFFLLVNGLPTILKIGAAHFLVGTEWTPQDIPASYGIFTMIVGSLYITAGAVITGVPIGIFTAVFLAKFCSKRLYAFINPCVQLLAGIPSIVYGFFGMILLVPFIKNNFGGNGFSILTASILLGIMILPTIIAISENAIRSVPESYYEGSLALGASHERTVFFVILPAARSGILASVILGIGRAVGETMAVIMVAGNQARMPDGILDGIRTMTTNIVLEMGYATGTHWDALIATGAVLFMLILLINLTFTYLTRTKQS